MTAHAIDQYLRRYAHSTAHAPWPFAQRQFDAVVVVPAFAEEPAFIVDAFQRHSATSVLLIVVANAPADAQAADVDQTIALLEQDAPAPLQWNVVGGDVVWQAADTPFAVWVIDCVSRDRLPTDEGVGLARKIGMDRALAAVARGNVRSAVIYCNDADGVWPQNYFDAVMTEQDSAVTFAFKHVGADAALPAQRAYDLRIRDYPASLTAAGSPYGFQALGSAMAVRTSAYAQVRGCPRRAAGEDFHLLAKLAKLGNVRHCPDICIEIHARSSLRVPFGTGRAVAQLHTLDDPLREPMFYSEHSYRLLHAFMALARNTLSGTRSESNEDALRKRCEQLIAKEGVAISADVFEVAPLTAALRRARDASPDAAQRLRQFHTWFDALRTLQLMHRLRDAGLHNIDARTLREQFPARYDRAQIR